MRAGLGLQQAKRTQDKTTSGPGMRTPCRWMNRGAAVSMEGKCDEWAVYSVHRPVGATMATARKRRRARRVEPPRKDVEGAGEKWREGGGGTCRERGTWGENATGGRG